MDLRYQEALENIGRAIETIKTRQGVEKTSLIHQNGTNIISKPRSIDNQLDKIVNISSNIYHLTNKIHEHSWESSVIETSYGLILIIPLFFDINQEQCPFFLQIVTQPHINLKNFFLNISNSIEIIIDNLAPINSEMNKMGNENPIETIELLDLDIRNSDISSILNNYLGTHSSLESETVIVYIKGISLNTLGTNQLQLDILTNLKFTDLRSLMLNSENLSQLIKKTEISSVKIECSENVHFIYPIYPESTPIEGSFISITTKNKSNIGLWRLLIPQIKNKIEKCLH